ncbi:MAG TPA: hypothetical protein VG734_09970 [Lacunisphaera sp.]|nr:hypothetical protein [Lacunisphaera sp.]
MDDGEWISWAYLNPLIQEQLEEPEKFVLCEDLKFEPGVEVSLLLVEAIREGPLSPLWGPLGEAYAAERLGLKLSRTHAQGHDGHWGNELVEVKTITREKRNPMVRVKTRGNFSVLMVVRVTDNYEPMIRSISRKELSAPPGAEYYWVDWDELQVPGVGLPIRPAPGRSSTAGLYHRYVTRGATGAEFSINQRT